MSTAAVPVLGDPVLGDPVLGDPVLGEAVLGDPALRVAVPHVPVPRVPVPHVPVLGGSLPAHPVARAGKVVAEVLDGLGVPDPAGLGGLGLEAQIRRWERLESRVRAVKLALVAEGTARGRDTDTGASSPTAWLARLTRCDPRTARAALAQADTLTTAAADPATAALAGDVYTGTAPLAQAVAAADAVTALPPEVDPAVRARAVDLARDAARADTPAAVRDLGTRLVALADPDRGPALLAAQLAATEHAAWANRTFTLSATPRAGLLDGRFALPVEAASMLRTAVHALAAPGALPAPTDPATSGPTTSGRGPGGEPDERSWDQRMADGLIELARRSLAHGQLPDTGGQRPQLVVTLDWDTLRTQLGAATLEDTTPTGTALSPATARRLACDAAVTPALLAGPGHPLDVGRTTRTVPAAIRRALALRDHGCVFPGCDRPPGWCDAHHIVHWAEGGPTALDNLVLLCAHHHRITHHHHWGLALTPDRRPRWRPPPWTAPPGTVWDRRGNPATTGPPGVP